MNYEITELELNEYALRYELRVLDADAAWDGLEAWVYNN